jgi:hypothetical protein
VLDDVAWGHRQFRANLVRVLGVAETTNEVPQTWAATTSFYSAM